MIQNIMFLCACSMAAPAPDTSRDELKKLEGQWNVVKIGSHGRTDEVFDHTAAIDRDTFRIIGKFGADRYKIKRIKGGEIDFIKQSEPGSGEILVGIYAIEGDTLTICFAVYGPKGSDEPPKRPAKFESPKDSPYRVYICTFRENLSSGDQLPQALPQAANFS